MIVWMLSILVPLRICAYYIQYDHSSAYRVVGVKNDLSSDFRSAFEEAVDAWNGGITDRSIQINASAGNSITDLDFSKATECIGVFNCSCDMGSLSTYKTQQLEGKFHI